MGKNILAITTKCIMIDFEDFKGKWITNKTGHDVTITRIEQVLVPIEQRMERTWHKDAKSYCKCNKDDKFMDDMAIQHIIVIEYINGQPLTY